MAERFVERRAAMPRESGRALIMRAGRAREVIAVFDRPDALDEAVKTLESNGFDRSQLRVLASRDVREHDLAACPSRAGGQARDRTSQGSLARIAVPNVLGLMVTPATVAPDGVIVAAHPQGQISRRRILLWMSLPHPEREATAREILARHARDVRAYMS